MSTTAPDLEGLTVLITRPQEQAANLSGLVQAEGGRAFVFPTLEIRETDNPDALNQIIDQLDNYDVAVFVSPNAVQHAVAAIHQRREQLPSQLRLACVGQGSARELERFGYKSRITPQEKSNSEALLALPDLLQVTNRKIVIFRGNGGRDVLRQTLTERGAQVDYAQCYRRAKPRIDAAPLTQALAKGAIDIITVTSAEGLRNLHEIAGAGARALLTKLPIVVISPRIAQVCGELGFETVPLVADNSSDEAIVRTIKAWRLSKKTL